MNRGLPHALALTLLVMTFVSGVLAQSAEPPPCVPIEESTFVIPKVRGFGASIYGLPDRPVVGDRWIVDGDNGLWTWGMLGWTRSPLPTDRPVVAHLLDGTVLELIEGRRSWGTDWTWAERSRDATCR